jgi:DNA-binding NarL/FixJ family response regulator
MKPIRVLIADDHAMIREGLRQLLEMQADIEVVGEAKDGSEALDECRNLRPDVVLLDVEMPVKDGIQTLREIRKSKRYGHLPVIMVTSRTGAKHRALAKEAGCNAYMGKPFNFPALIKQINELTGYDLQLS